MEPNELIRHIALPQQTIKKLNFCSSNKPQRVADWASLLHATRVNETSAALYRSLPEINLLKTTPYIRFGMLENLRPYVQHTINGLSRGFLHQPIALPIESQKGTIVAQSLQKHMIDGYILCIRDALTNKKVKFDSDAMFITSMHRAMIGIGRLFMRSYQIYTQPARGLWQSLHILFQIAEHFELLNQHVTDEVQITHKYTSIQNAYLRSILLASAKPHQLNQNDIAAVYEVFAEWAEHLRLHKGLSKDNDHFYYINLNRDTGPQYKSRISKEESQDQLKELVLKPLISQLSHQNGEVLGEVETSAVTIPREINPSVLDHLLSTWGNIAQRKQERRPIKMTADICIGLSDCHYYVSDEQVFEHFVADNLGNNATPLSPEHAQNDSARTLRRINVQNISEGGYCLLWNSQSPLKVEAGELVGVRELGKRLWSIGVVRWIRQKKSTSQLGIQTLSDKALPYAVSIIDEMADEDSYTRALYFPPTQYSGQTATLLTSSAPYHSRDKIKVLENHVTSIAKLEERVFSTGSIQQFNFQTLENDTKINTKQNGDSKW